MKINLSKYAGFCEGVKRAYDIVEKIAKDKKIKKPVYVLGSLVHNDDVVKKIEKLGIKKLSFDGNIDKFFRSNKRKIGTLVVTAHGIGPKFYKLAKEKDIDVVDTTCPKVIKVQKLAKLFSDKKCQVIIIGKKTHKEVEGIYEWSGRKAIIVESVEDINVEDDFKGEIVVISQTTQGEDLVKMITKKIKSKYPKRVKYFDTLCETTHNRQGEIKKIARKNDVMIIIGSSESANSTHLWEISKEINPKSYFIENARGLNKKWFKDVKKIGVSAGASTPPWIIKEVCNFIDNKL